ncbi:PTS sugar transporter subunit IIC [Erysipelothrix urinaevulpis]|uniref:PTS sugar transporter subunit IIC n=1 Tax=Erysipelothrix urinaevulpis TaxID=2683717 RepID=UPI0013592502|nr:PTS sugar transporter subunit IIC [Erysipelothrix urinaevulpis]
MNKILDSLEQKLVPIASKLDQNRYLSAVKDGFFAVMSFLIIGSIFLLFANLPINGYPEFMTGLLGEGWKQYFLVPFFASMNVMTLFVMIGIARSLASSHNMDEESSIIGTLVAFLILTPFEAGESGLMLAASAFSAEGLFLGIFTAIFTVEIMRIITEKGWVIKMHPSVPENVSRSFSTLIPGLFVILFFGVIRLGFSFTSFQTIQNFIFTALQTPLMALGDTLPARMILTVVEQLLWSFGLHGNNIAGGAMAPIYQTLTVQNAEATMAGLLPPNIITVQFNTNFVKVGGAGSTLGLVYLMATQAKSEQYKSLGRLSFAPAIFNINEPVIFGVPIVLNPLMIIPFFLAPLTLVVITYFAMFTGLVPYTSGVNIPWSTPPIISGLLITGWRGALLQVVNILVATAIYYPFFKIIDQKAYDEENPQE